MRSSTPWTKNLLVAFNDGLTIAFCLAIILMTAATEKSIIILIGVSLFIALLTGLAAYFCAQDRSKTFSERTALQDATLQAEELRKTISMYKALDFDDKMQQQAAIDIDEDARAWKNYLRQNLPSKEKQAEPAFIKTALSVALSFLLGSFLAIIILQTWPLPAHLKLDAVIAVCLLATMGFLKGRKHGALLWWSTSRPVLLALLAGIAAYYIGQIFAA